MDKQFAKLSLGPLSLGSKTMLSTLDKNALYEIFKYLALRERLMFENIDEKLNQALDMVWKEQKVLYCSWGWYEEPIDCHTSGHNVSETDVIVDLTQVECLKALSRCSNLVALYWYYPCDEYFGAQLAASCPYLEHIYLSWSWVSAKGMLDYVEKVKDKEGAEVMLKCVFWSYIRTERIPFMADYVKFLGLCPKLRTLGVPSVNPRPEAISHVMPKLRYLFTYPCNSTPCKMGDTVKNYLKVILKGGDNLKFVNLWYLSESDILKICKNVPKLKKVQVYKNAGPNSEARRELTSRGIEVDDKWGYCKGQSHPFNGRKYASNYGNNLYGPYYEGNDFSDEGENLDWD